MATLTMLDLDRLVKGDFIEPDVIAEYTETEVGTKAYDFALLRFRADVETAYRKVHGRRATVKAERSGLRILIDSEAALHNAARFELLLGQLRRTNARNKDVDESCLRPEERAAHYRELEIEGKYLAAIKSVRKNLAPVAHKRRTPGL